MKLPKLHVRDFFWLVLVVALCFALGILMRGEREARIEAAKMDSFVEALQVRLQQVEEEPAIHTDNPPKE